MRTLSANALTRMRSPVDDSMFDTCKIAARGAIDWDADPGSTAPQSGDYGSEIPCGVGTASGEENQEGSQSPENTVKVRVARGTTIASDSRLKVTKRHGTALSAEEEYIVIGAPVMGPTALTLNCKRILANSPK